MSQFSAPTTRRSDGDIDVYTGLLGAALLIMVVGVFMLATANSKHSESREGANDGGMFKIVGKR